MAVSKGDTEKIVYTNSLNIIFSEYSEGGEKVFLLDDFWGSIRHKGGANHSKLQMILKGIMESENQRLIITTRDYILESEMNGNRLCKPFLERLRGLLRGGLYSWREGGNSVQPY